MRIALLCIALFAIPVSADEPPSAAELRAAAAKSLPLLQKGADGYMAERKCFACHHQTLPLLALKTAQSRGLPIDAEFEQRLLRFVEDSLESGRSRYLEGRGQGGNTITAGYALWTLSLSGKPAGPTTTMVVDYLTTAHKDSTYWRVTTSRPPSETSHFAATYAVLRGLRDYATQSQQAAVAERLQEVRKKLNSLPAQETEDRVFRLGSLRLLDADRKLIERAAAKLLKTQRADGGWSQLDDGESDAYATGTALFMLFETGTIRRHDRAANRALRYLLKTQEDCGSWHVRSRSKPIQTYFETGFPHEKDQFISSAATGWAATALLLACPEHVEP